MPKLQKRKLNLEEDVLQDYIYYCQERDLRPKTIQVYEKCLKLFLKFLQEEFKIVMLEDVEEKHIREYLKFTKERGKYSYVSDVNSVETNNTGNRKDFGKQISSKTLDGYLRNLKIFFNYCYKNKLMMNCQVKCDTSCKNA